jgi:leucyl-tRNA synthetase
MPRPKRSASKRAGPWPEYDARYLYEDTEEIPVQVNGKVRAVINVPRGSDKEAVLAAAKAEPRVQRHLEGKTLVKEVFVPGKLANLVVK